MQATATRPYMSKDHLASLITTEAGAIHVSPQETDRIVFDIASSNSMPANLPDSRNGSHVLDIGHGVTIRASGSVHREDDGTWGFRYALHGSQYPSDRELTPAQDKRARERIASMLTEWANTHEGDIAQADDINRNNDARTLEENIARHAEALKILKRELNRCEQGKTYTQYPELPTARR